MTKPYEQLTPGEVNRVDRQLSLLQVGAWAGVIGFVIFALCLAGSLLVNLGWSGPATPFLIVAAGSLFLAFACWSWSFVLLLLHVPREFVRSELRRVSEDASQKR